MELGFNARSSHPESSLILAGLSDHVRVNHTNKVAKDFLGTYTLKFVPLKLSINSFALMLGSVYL